MSIISCALLSSGLGLYATPLICALRSGVSPIVDHTDSLCYDELAAPLEEVTFHSFGNQLSLIGLNLINVTGCMISQIGTFFQILTR
ncbi:MAG TPA: hypothetical protein VKQ72_04215 [Aggregatilineales bacterium]|nr:hypothetical protein [Aggregatilineales bacterium]